MSDKVFYSKIINPFKAPIYKGSRKYQVYFKLEIVQIGNNKLPYFSISGVHAPLKSGNCLGNAGQNIDNYIDKAVSYNHGWDKKLYKQLIALWKTYHLHDVTIDGELYKILLDECEKFPTTNKQPAWI